MRPVQNLGFIFHNFKLRFGVRGSVKYNLDALLANFPKHLSKQKAVILKENDHFIFSIVIYSNGKIFQSSAKVPLLKCRTWSRLWQKGVIETLSKDIIRQNHMWRNLRGQVLN